MEGQPRHADRPDRSLNREGAKNTFISSTETASMRHAVLRGRRVLIVEDVALLAATYEDILMEAGAEVVGPATTLDVAQRLAEEETLSAALLDIRLNGDEIWPVARRLNNRGVPFVFVTGLFDNEGLPVEWRGRPILAKPAGPHAIIETVVNVEREARLRKGARHPRLTHRLVGMALDVTEPKGSEDHARLGMQKLSDETKNLMAVVQAIS
jgi:DNA-binding response OmpR family regulator